MTMYLLLSLVVGVAQLVSSAADVTEFVDCGPLDTACECAEDATVCNFQFYVEYAFTLTRYNFSLPYLEGQGEHVYIDETGNFIVSQGGGKCMDGNFVKKAGESDGLYCNEVGVCMEKNKLCTEPITADGNVLKMFLSVNQQFPGPTLIVHEGQIVAVDVHNNLSTEGISIHWHGQHQIKTNFMDGVGLVTQCPILPGSSFRYIFRASPSGTFWYHSQMGSQRGNSLFGALIVKEKEIKYPVSFIDNPASHTITVMDWYRQDPEEFFQHKKIAVGWLIGLPPFTAPSDLNPSLGYSITRGPDNVNIGTNAFWSALIHGKGRHSDVPYQRSNLRVYEVEPSQTYRFRLIHTGTMYAFRFSIDGHRLKVMATDGYLVEPMEVDYIAIHTGERYDFLLDTKQSNGNYWMKAETFEMNFGGSANPPYNFTDHKAEAILHYTGTNKPRSPEYANISSTPPECTQESPCKMLNCPFEKFHPSYNIECISIDKVRLVEPTPSDEMPDESPDVTYFMNLAGYVHKEAVSSINDKLFRFPSYPLTTRYEKNDESSFCDVNSECESKKGCKCTTVMDIGDNMTVRLVLSGVGRERKSTHSIHIHGHSVHILKVAYGNYSRNNGFLLGSSRDLTCTEDGDDMDVLDDNRCPNPRFRFPNTKISLDKFAVRKDTFIVPAGGYVVVQFRSNNPGYWFLQCLVDLYFREGMSMIMKEAVDKISNKPPEEMEYCDPFIWDVNDFMQSLENGNGCGSITMPSISAILLIHSVMALVIVL